MSGSWLIARKRNRLDTVDVAWGLAFFGVAWFVYGYHATGRSLLVALLVSIWGLRLALHIYRRSRIRGDDRRYRELQSAWKGNIWLRAYMSIFLLQGLLVIIVSLPVILLVEPQRSSSTWLTIGGVIIWVIGFIIEAIADKQLSLYLKTTERPKVLQSGLWHFSRHPNYFGELLQWWAIALIALQVRFGWFGLIGPLTLSILIVFVSGIPPIERHRAKDPEYKQYQKRTSALLLLPPRH